MGRTIGECRKLLGNEKRWPLCSIGSTICLCRSEERRVGKEFKVDVLVDYKVTGVQTCALPISENARASYIGGLKSSQRVEVPTGISLFPKEAQFPRAWAERLVNVANFSVMKKGGHFAALEVPDVYADRKSVV